MLVFSAPILDIAFKLFPPPRLSLHFKDPLEKKLLVLSDAVFHHIFSPELVFPYPPPGAEVKMENIYPCRFILLMIVPFLTRSRYQEGLAHVCLVTSSMTIVRAKIDVPVPRKRRGDCSQHEKGLNKFYDQIIQSILR